MSGTRTRSLPVYHRFPNETDSSGKDISNPHGGDILLATGKQITVSEGHPRDRKTGKWLAGGPFYMSRVMYDFTFGHVSEACLESADRFYTGPVYCKPPTAEERKALGYTIADEFGSKNDSKMSADGATAIARCSPANPSSNLGQAIVETRRDGLPALLTASTWRDRTLRAKRAGDEYLNYQYGWVPLVNDVLAGSKAAARHGQILENYQSKEGYNTRRGYGFPSEHESTQITGIDGNGALFPGVSSSWWLGGSKGRTVERVRTTERWFSGCFAFPPSPTIDSWDKTIGAGREAQKLFGLELTPELLWEVTPWSWAVDWVTNVGDVLSNVTAFSGINGQVMRYGYMMEETIDTITAHLAIGGFRHKASKKDPSLVESIKEQGSCSSSITTVTKRRAEANPFGFGITWEGLSPFQISIAAALGISRLL